MLVVKTVVVVAIGLAVEFAAADVPVPEADPDAEKLVSEEAETVGMVSDAWRATCGAAADTDITPTSIASMSAVTRVTLPCLRMCVLRVEFEEEVEVIAKLGMLSMR